MKNIYFITIFLALFSCKKWQASSEESPVAKVNGSYLYLSDISTNNDLVQDSVLWKKEQIDFWIKKQLWLEEAEASEELESIERKVVDYRESLMVDAFKENYIEKSKLVVTEEMILEYYKENQFSFLLNEEMFKVQYFLVENTEGNNNLVKTLNNGEVPEELKGYCSDNINKCITNAAWVGESLLQDMGLPTYLWVSSSKFQKYFLDNDMVYLYRIEVKKKVGEVAPLDKVKGDIKQILSFQIEKELIQKKEDELFINAQNKKSFEIY